ncbi:MAG: acyl-CoA dehydrogenase family protein [Actinomycetota bacterium]
MFLKPTEEQHALIEAIHDFSVNEVRPNARDFEAVGQVPERITKQLFEMGISTPVPEEFGGQGTFDAVTTVLIAEELAWGDPGTAYEVLNSGAAATLIDLLGTQQQKQDLLTRIADGQHTWVALAERDAATDVTRLDTRAVAADDAFELSGVKYGVAGPEATIGLVVAEHEGPAVFLVADTAALETKAEDKLGLRSASTSKLTLDRTKATLLGDTSIDPKNALARVKLINAGICIGLGRAALEYATKYAKERTAFGRPIGAFQAISFKIADRAMDIDSARLYVWKAASAVDGNHPGALSQVMAACGHASKAALAAADDGVQILGGHGYMRDHPEEMWYRDALTLSTFDSSIMVGDPFISETFKVGAK